MTKFFAIVLACIFAVTPLWASEPFSDYRGNSDCGYCVPLEIDRLAALLGDEVLRDMVCRLSSERYTPARLSNALGVPEGQVMQRVNTLRGWGLVRLVRRDSARTIVEPLPGGQTLARWASKYCPLGDACGNLEAIPAARNEMKRENVLGGARESTRSDGGTDLKGKLVTVFGGSGFIGRHVVKVLVAEGARVRVAVRNAEAATYLKRLGEPGQVEVVALTLSDWVRVPETEPRPKDAATIYWFAGEDKIEQAVADADMVVNAVGILNEMGQQTFGSLHYQGARQIAAVAATSKVERLVLVSSISSDPDSTAIYAQTKALGEIAVRGIYPDVTVVRPSVVFGPDDGFFNHLASLTRFSPVLPMFGGGETLFQPVFVDDVSAAIVRILKNPDTKRQTYEIGGPRKMTMREIFSMVTSQTDRKRWLLPLPMWLGEAQAALLGWLPNAPLTRDHLELLRRDNVVSPQSLGLTELGIVPTPVEDVVPMYIGNGKPGRKTKPAF